jgi:hypothetical protein
METLDSTVGSLGGIRLSLGGLLRYLRIQGRVRILRESGGRELTLGMLSGGWYNR